MRMHCTVVGYFLLNPVESEDFQVRLSNTTNNEGTK